MDYKAKTDFEWMIEDTQTRVLDAVLPDVIFDGWSDEAFAQALKKAEIPEQNAKLAFPRGLIDLVSAFHRFADREMLEELPKRIGLSTSIGKNIKAAVMLRLEIANQNKDAVRRAAAFFALPHHLPIGTALLWGTVDEIWNAVGVHDRGLSHYTRRASLVAIYSATLMFWLQDDDGTLKDIEAFLDRRLADQMKIGKFTSTLKSPFQKKTSS